MADQTKRLIVGREGPGSRAVLEAAALVARGGLVAFPTETVYGIGANAELPAALERLAELKGRAADKPFSIHIADKADLERHVKDVPVVARKLIDKFWPGPLTIVFGRDPGSIGVRLPAHDVARAFLRAANVTIVAPSANLAGDKPASNADEVLAALDGRIDAVLDGGPAPLAQSSTVVRVWRSGWALLREGIISRVMIEKALRTSILFLCTGNSCRSPIAEAVCRRLLARRHGVTEEDLGTLGYEVASAGTAAIGGGRASSSASSAAAGAGLDLSTHRTRPATLELLSNATHVYAMGESQAASARDLCPSAGPRIELLDPDGSEILDPIGFPADEFARVVRRIEVCVERRVKDL